MEIFALGLPLSILYYLAHLRDSEKKLLIAQSVLLLCGATAATAVQPSRGGASPRLPW